MKCLPIIICAVAISFTTASFRRHHGRHTIIETRVDNSTIHVEYSGSIVFGEDKKSISNMSPDSYFMYKNKYDKLTAECDSKGRITYQFNGDKIDALNDEAKQLIAEAVVEIDRTRKKG